MTIITKAYTPQKKRINTSKQPTQKLYHFWCFIQIFYLFRFLSHLIHATMKSYNVAHKKKYVIIYSYGNVLSKLQTFARMGQQYE